LLYKRADLEFSKTNGSNKSIILYSNNPLLKVCSANKAQQLLNNINVNYNFIPCDVEIITEQDFEIGDYLSITHNNINYPFYVNKIINKNNTSKKISCYSTLTEEEAAEQLADSGDIGNMGSVEYFFTDELIKVDFQECSKHTNIYYSITFNADEDGYFNIKVGGKHNRQFIYTKGNNTISSILDFNFKDGVYSLEIENLDINNVDNYSLSILYKNCMILNNIDEADYPDNPQVEEDEEIIERVNVDYIYGLMELTKDAELVVSPTFFNQIVLAKEGTEELVVKGENCNIYYNYKDTGIELIFEGKYKNRIRITEEDMEKKCLNGNLDTIEYYRFKAPMKIGTILEYIKPLSTNDTTYAELEQLKIIDDGINVIYGNYVLKNIVLHEPVGLTDTWTLVMTDGEAIPEVTADYEIFNDGNFYVGHYATGEIKSALGTGKNTWVVSNTVNSLSTLYKEVGGIKYYTLDDPMSSKYSGRKFKPTNTFFGYETKLNSKFFKQCCYALLELENTNLTHPTL
jgi:hypothetical protein